MALYKYVYDMIGGTEVPQCGEFVYLGGVITQDGFCCRDVDRRIGLESKVNKSSSISITGSVDCLNHSHTWTKKDQKRKLKTFEMAVLRKIGLWNNKKRQKAEC